MRDIVRTGRRLGPLRYPMPVYHNCRGRRLRIECIAGMVDIVDYFICKLPSGKGSERI